MTHFSRGILIQFDLTLIEQSLQFLIRDSLCWTYRVPEI